MEFTKDQQRRVDEARNVFHRTTMDVLTEAGIDHFNLDITEAGESIALEGVLEIE